MFNTTSLNLDPSNSAMWLGITAMFTELAGLFPDEYIHVGFDEVSLNDWNTTAITQWMQAHGMKTLKEVETYFLSRVQTITKTLGKHLVIWDDPVGEGVIVDPDITLEVWNAGMDLVQQLSQQGYRTIFASDYYLDNLANTWVKIFTNMAMDSILPGLMGAELCMWGEQIDITNAISRVWPIAAAFSELLWSPNYATYPRIPGLNAERLNYWRCSIRTRGVNAVPIIPGWCPLASH